jgi:hypothetical protein
VPFKNITHKLTTGAGFGFASPVGLAAAVEASERDSTVIGMIL